MLPTVAWVRGGVRLIDQRRLPGRTEYRLCRRVGEVAEAIRTLAVRGAPAIGVAASYGMALAARAIPRAAGWEDATRRLEAARERLARTRPTAVNLQWALDRVRRVWKNGRPAQGGWAEAVLAEAQAIEQEDLEMNRAIARHGATLIRTGWHVLTYCNTGGLATAGVGTALGLLSEAHRRRTLGHVYACETRPALQGLRLTAWELGRAKVPFTVIADNMAGALMAQGRVQAVVVGADRIAANGDVANKIGTYTLAVLASHHRVPFYVAAPSSTVDPSVPSGSHIPIEERSTEEFLRYLHPGARPRGVRVAHPAFDVTPARFVTAIVTDCGIRRPPYRFVKASGAAGGRRHRGRCVV